MTSELATASSTVDTFRPISSALANVSEDFLNPTVTFTPDS